ncbi:c6 zinc finger domain-containing protein [Paraphoma chrysanthemicola]|nr:c6 zinc finger domain-containing protein [Paraphoma chrysanthemicola]
MSTNAPRTRLACNACTRRKVKCSKTVPCTNCERRGEASTCGSDAGSGVQQSPRRPSSSRELELDYLRRRVSELQGRSSASPVDHQSAIPNESQVDTGAPDPHEHENSAPGDTNDSVAHDAASILEFLAWGRRKDPDVHAVVSPQVDTVEQGEDEAHPFDDLSSLAVLQLLLPNSRQVRHLVDYHCDALLWYHGSFFGPTFRAQLDVFWSRHGGQLASPGLNLQWVALLFSVMTGSLTCAPPEQAELWGYRGAEPGTLSKRWFQAVRSCLNRADYTSNLSIFSCQAVATATISAHLLGFSSSQSIHLAAAVRVAQSLGLHRLGPEAKGNTTEKEIGRRVWCQLCSQDWFGIPFSESYLINPLYATSEPPANCHDHDLLPLHSSIPTITSYSRFLYDIASIMPRLQDGLMSCNTPYTRYEQVLKWDTRLRTLAIQERPVFLTACSLESGWPSWIPWARRALAISSSHKIIMIHRSFLSDSFSNPAFSFTRRTCLAASKTIIKEYRQVVEESGPILWIHQAFAVAASIILSLDMLHRDREAQEHTEHRQLVESVISILQSCHNSMIASRGLKLLEALLREVSKVPLTTQGTKRNRDGTVANTFNVPAFVRTLHESAPRQVFAASTPHEPPPTYTANETSQTSNISVPDFLQADFDFSFAPQVLEGMNGFENLLYLANHDFAGTSWN